ncbi:MAG: phosphoribosylamine--glycine ligase, partial [Steroidobacterales bacterium]
DALLAYALRERIDLTIVGPEAPLVLGVVDRFSEKGLRCFGPSRQAARLEGSKAFAKAFLARHRIPTARSRTFTAQNFNRDYVLKSRTPVVVKASGLAAGKGVVIAGTPAEALAAVESMFGGRFGTAGQEVVVEEFLEGEEASFIVMAGGGHAIPLASSQDHKRRDDRDEGPNTGGMGAYSPAPVVTSAIHARAMREVIEPTLRGLASEGIAYTGFLYAGLMIAADGTPNVLEFNCRCGDPETQPIVARLKSDLGALCEAAIDGELDQVKAEWDPRAALGVVMAAAGYPDSYAQDDVISGLDAAAALPGKVFHAGTKLKDGKVVTAGGRVLCAVGLGASVIEAQRSAYALVKCIDWRGVHYRRDIGGRAIERERH